jgi:hypothetical protein
MRENAVPTVHAGKRFVNEGETCFARYYYNELMVAEGAKTNPKRMRWSPHPHATDNDHAQ